VGLVLTMLVLGPLAGRSSAQEIEPVAGTRARLGPFSFTPQIRLQNLGLDSNVYNVGDAVSDFTFAVTPDLLLGAGNSRTGMTLHSVTDFVYFAEQRSERSVNESITAAGQARVRRFIAVGSAGFLTSRERPTAEIDARSRRIESNASGSIGLALSSRLSALIGGQYRQTGFNADAIFDGSYLAKELNRQTRAATATLRFAVSPLTTLVASAHAARTRFELSPIRDSDSRGLFGGIELNPHALVSGAVSLGYERFTPHSPTLPTYDGLVGSVGVQYHPWRLSSIGFDLERHIEYSYSPDRPYYVLEAYGVSLQRQISRRVQIEASGTRGRYIYRRATTDGAAVTSIGDRKMRLLDLGLGAGFRSTPNTRLDFVWQYRDRDSDFANRSFSGTRLMTSVTYGF
jgi:hypothetical protein